MLASTPAPWLAVGAFDVLGKVGIRAFGSDAAFFAGDNLSGILDPVENAVMHPLQDIVGSDRSTGIAETATSRRALGSTLKSFEVFEVFVVQAGPKDDPPTR
jgi:hypothetical protein